MVYKVSDIVGTRRIEENIILSYSNDISFCYKLSLPEIYSLSEKDYDEISNDLYRFSKSLPNRIIEHWQSFNIKKEFEIDTLKNVTFLQKATKEYYRGRKFTEFEAYLYITIPFNKVLRTSFSIRELKERWRKAEDEILQIYENKKLIEESISILNSSKYFRATPMDETDIKANILGITTSFKTNISTDIQFNPFMIGENYYSCYGVNSLKNLPEKITNCKKDAKMSTQKANFYKSFIQSLSIEMLNNSMLNMYIFHEGHEKLKSEIQKQEEEFNTWSAWSTTNFNGRENLAKYLNEMDNDESIRLCRAHFDLFVWESTQKGLNVIEGEISAALSELDLKAYRPIVDDQVGYLLCSIPGNEGYFPEEETFLTDIKQALCFVPVCGNFKEDRIGILLNERLNNKPFYKDFWEYPYEKQIITARNFMVVADSGKGKSVLTTHMYRTYLEMDYSLVLCDIGHSNQTLAKLYKEKINYVEFKEGQGIGINPFTIKSEKDLTSQKIQCLNDFVSIHWKKDNELDDKTRVSLNVLIEDYYRNAVEKHSFPGFFNYIKTENWKLLKRLEINPEFFNIDEFVHICGEYVTGIYDFLYNGSGEQIEVGDKPGIFFEFSNILDNPVIFPIMSLMVRDAVDTKIWGDSTKKKVLVWEEAAKIIKFPGQLKAIDYTAQTVRKYNGSQGLVVQTIDNIPDNEIGKAIINNTHTYFIFEQERGLKSLGTRLDLNDHVLDEIKSIKSNLETKNPYTEFAALLSQQINCYRLELPREVYWAYVSDKDKKAKLYKEYEKEGSIEKAILNMVEYEKVK